MRGKTSILLFSGLFIVQLTWTQVGYNRDYFRAPMDIGMYLSGNFGELRSNHFHAGIDIKTQGITGLRVYAAAEGYISRIKIEAAGYGNTLYITHPAGYTTVYAHLDRFRRDIADYVRKKQYSNQQHALNIFPGKGEWPVAKGDIVAYSGTSGYSFGPHLHFEIRDAARQEPMNAMLFGFDIEDLVAPRFFSLYVYPGDENSIACDSYDKTRLEVISDTGKYKLKAGDTINVNGNIGFGIEAFDYLNGAHNRCGIYRIRMLVDEVLKYEWKMDRFSFGKARYVNSYIDFEEKARNGKLVQKTFVEPNNKSEQYVYVENDGMHDFTEQRSYRVKFMLYDAYMNTSELEFVVKGGSPTLKPLPEPENNYAADFSWSSPNEFTTEGLNLRIPEGALYKDLKFNYSSHEKPDVAFSPVHVVHDPYTPVHLACDLGIRPVGLPEELHDKALVVIINEEGEISTAGGEWKDGMLYTQIREFGQYTVLIDTAAPVIRSLDLDDSGNAVNRKNIRFKVTDETSGVKSYEGYIDNEWVLFEYDAKNDLVSYSFDPDRLTSGKSHELELYIIDNKENIAYYYAEFYW